MMTPVTYAPPPPHAGSVRYAPLPPRSPDAEALSRWAVDPRVEAAINRRTN